MVLKLFSCLENFFNFSLIDSLDVTKVLFCGHDDTGDGAKASAFEFGNICSIDPALLKLLNFEERGGLDFFGYFFEFFFSNFLFFLGLFSLLHGRAANKITKLRIISAI